MISAQQFTEQQINIARASRPRSRCQLSESLTPCSLLMFIYHGDANCKLSAVHVLFEQPFFERSWRGGGYRWEGILVQGMGLHTRTVLCAFVCAIAQRSTSSALQILRSSYDWKSLKIVCVFRVTQALLLCLVCCSCSCSHKARLLNICVVQHSYSLHFRYSEWFIVHQHIIGRLR